MITANVKIENLGVITSFFESFPELIKDVGEQVTERVKASVVARTPIGIRRRRKDHTIGHAKRSWSNIEYTSGGYSFESNIPYIRPLSKGSDIGELPWPSEGDRTKKVGRKIFSSRVVDGLGAGLIEPLFEDKRFISDLSATIVKYIKENIKKSA